MRIFLNSIGCRLNQSEIEAIANQFRALGHQIVSSPTNADVAIVNTCAVTVKAAADSRKQLRRAYRNGAKMVIATGCWATLEPDSARNLPGVEWVYSNDQKELLVAEFLNIPVEQLLSLTIKREPLPGERARTRAFIKVQEGCNNFCTYCLTRVARGKSTSRKITEIDRDLQAAIDGGAREIVLTGVQLGAWGRDFSDRKNLKDLIIELLKNYNLERIRLSSIEPWDLDFEMFSLWNDKRLCRHLHVPLQSGSDRILKKMGRPISTLQYANLIDEIRQVIPEVAITTDIIVGFPGETQEDFNATKAFIKSINYAGGHVFTYSPRPGTAAFNMVGQVEPQVKKERNAALQQLFEQSSLSFRAKFINQTINVLWESSQQDENKVWHLSGLTDNYLRVYAFADEDLWNTINPVRIYDHHASRPALLGEILSGV